MCFASSFVYDRSSILLSTYRQTFCFSVGIGSTFVIFRKACCMSWLTRRGGGRLFRYTLLNVLLLAMICSHVFTTLTLATLKIARPPSSVKLRELPISIVRNDWFDFRASAIDCNASLPNVPLISSRLILESLLLMTLLKSRIPSSLRLLILRHIVTSEGVWEMNAVMVRTPAVVILPLSPIKSSTPSKWASQMFKVDSCDPPKDIAVRIVSMESSSTRALDDRSRTLNEELPVRKPVSSIDEERSNFVSVKLIPLNVLLVERNSCKHTICS
mmetsp:Transcript_21979/g.44077  ORF Transcript_21979/g.44077 Transcript_21979/m.44077 type:complete len:272 (+) Transcript_21979:1850-2665(+)